MLVLHATLGPDDTVLVWAESLARAGAPATQDELGDVIAGPATTARLVLPGSDGQALPSPDLCRIDSSLAKVAAASPCMPVPVEVAAVQLAAGQALDLLGMDDHERPRGVALGSDIAALRELARHAAAIVLRQEYVPDVRFLPDAGGASRLEARWSPLPQPAARDALDAAIASAPAALDAREAGADELRQPRSARMLRLVAAFVDDLVRARLVHDTPRLVASVASPAETMHDRWLRALTSPDATIDGPADALDRLAAEVSRWQQRLRAAAQSPWRLLLRLEEPQEPASYDDEEELLPPPWTLRYLLQLRADRSVLIPAETAWDPKGSDRAVLEARGFHAGEHLLGPLAQAARLFEPIADSLGAAQPAGCELDGDGAHAFLSQVAPLLEQSGFGVAVPAWWSAGRGRAPVTLRANVSELHGGRRHMDSLNLATLVGYDWRAAVGDAELTRAELTRLADQKSRLVKVRGRWVELDSDGIRAALAHLERAEQRAHVASVAELLRMSLGVAPDADGIPVSGVGGPEGTDIAELLARAARAEAPTPAPLPAGLVAQLRPYQVRGFQWLATMSELRLGACLADDMGLGKSVQLLAAVQHAWERSAAEARLPTLVVCPTSVLTNWLREAARFTPALPAFVHHGADRPRGTEFAERAASQAIVFTSYALLARDIEHLAAVEWRALVLDEAQNVKNPGTRHARAARSIPAGTRVALTGTPVENHAGDLWAIMEFLNPGLLGSQADFRRRYLIPIQTGSFPEAAARLRQVVAPFVLRRSKTDPDVIVDLPDKLEQVAWCQLTTEQASLYEAIVRDAAQVLRMPPGQARRSGIERRGLILATIAKLKQACNHPAQLLGDGSRIDGRSGKLQRLEQLLEQVLDAGERALVFTQYVAMGRILREQLRETFAREVLFLHGGTTRAERDSMIERFQDAAADAPPILVLSLKAGGSGLNLTAASHVFHFDRWWNPATEQQATDRAFRIGQTRDVQVHALVCAGTVEERIDLMLRQKRGVAATLVGSGEQWVTELDDDELLDLLALRRETMLQDGRLDHLDAREWQRGAL